MQKVRFLDILVIFKLDLGQITFNPVVLVHCESGMRRNQNFEFLEEKVSYVFRLFDFWIFFSPFLFLLFPFFAAVIDLLLGLLTVKKLLRKCHRDNF